MTLLEPILHYLVTCRKKKVTLQAVVDGAQRDRRQVLRVLDKLTEEGYLQEVADEPLPPGNGEFGPSRRNPTWRIVGELATRPKPNPPRKRSMRSLVWSAILVKRVFTKAQLGIISGASAWTVDEYVRQLEEHGYIRREGKDGGKVVYMLLKPKQLDPPVGLFGGGS